MIIPYRVDVPFNHRPLMNWLVVAGVIVFFIFHRPFISNAFIVDISGDNPVPQVKISSFVLNGWGVKGLFGHMWLHAGLLHLIGNLIFLWLFGNAVCSKIGNVFYVPIYIGLGLIAAASHLIFDGSMAVGASGVINGIVGIYLVLFPENSISCFYLLIFRPVFFTISGYWLILMWFVFDLIGAISGTEGVAYMAHIGGFLGGFGLALLMLKLEWIKMERDEKSILQLIKPKQRKVDRVNREALGFWKKEREKYQKRKIQSKQTTVYNPKPIDEYIRFLCPCGQKIKVPRVYAGKKGRCPKCRAQIEVPER